MLSIIIAFGKGKEYLKQGLEDYYNLVKSLDCLFKGDYDEG